MIAVDVETAVKCIMEVFRVKSWKEMRNLCVIWDHVRNYLL